MIFILISILFVFTQQCLSQYSADPIGSYNWGLFKPQLIHAISQSQNNPLTISQLYFDNKEAEQSLRYKFPNRQSDKIIYNYRFNTGDGNYAIQDVYDPLLGYLQMTQNYIRLDSTDWIDTTKNITSSKTEDNDFEIGFIYSIAFEQFEISGNNTERFLELMSIENEKIIIKSSDNQHKFVIQGKNLKEKISFRGLASDQANNWNVESLLQYIRYGFTNQIQKKSTIIFIKTAVLMNVGAEIQVYYTPFVDKKYTYIDDEYIKENTNLSIQISFEKSFNIQSSYDQHNNKIQQQIIRLLTNKNKLSKQMKITQYNNIITQKEMTCAQLSFSNLMGGIQYSYGDLQCVQDEENCKMSLPLFSTTPSRFGFPRPFLWDDGFHQMISCQWNVEFCKQDIEKWFNTISLLDGWIPREQPRGAEVRSYIPWLFEDNRDGNPPSFLFNLLYIKNLGSEHTEFIKKIIPSIEKWFDWWMNIQRVKPDIDQNSDTLLFKWWGPSEDTNLGSGMDDWPRIDTFDNKIYISKYNVDASAWAYFFSSSLAELTNNSTYIQLAEQIKQSINDVLLNHEDLIYYDYLQNKSEINNEISITKYHLSSHLGYPNFIPLIVGLVDDQDVLEKQIQALMDDQTLWTPFGIRSLNINDEYFGNDSNYWRGPIWINIQYLLLRSMKKYYWNTSPLAQTFYENLRTNIISTVCGEFEERGYFFEHFNQNLDGKGSGNHPFNGWTSLITLIITESYI